MASKDPETFEVKGKPFRCQVCNHDLFTKRSAQLNTAALSFLDLDWMNQSATCLVCAECGYVHWFVPPWTP